MKKTRILSLVCITGLIAVIPAMGKDKPGRGGHDTERRGEAPAVPPTVQAVQAPQKAPSQPQPFAKVTISTEERRVIQEQYATHINQNQPTEISVKKGKKLPPGLAKKSARGKPLPPAWQEKCVPGEVMAPEVLQHAEPLPPVVVSKLPPPPTGTITVRVEGKVVRLLEATREILDVFDIHF